MSATGTTTGATGNRKLDQTHFPPRVRRIVDSLLQLVSDQFEWRLEGMLAEFEQQLIRLAEDARHPEVQAAHRQALRTLQLGREELVPRFLLGVEAALANLDGTVAAGDDAKPFDRRAGLSLVDDAVIDNALVLADIAQRCEARTKLSLHLLGQRFGVLAAAPAFDAARLPLGPHVLCAVLQDASESLQLPPVAQQLLLRLFERTAMADYAELTELFNATLASEGVLPALTYVPLRVRARAVEPAPASPREARDARDDSARPHSGWIAGLGSEPADAGAGHGPGFAALQALLARRRDRQAGTSVRAAPSPAELARLMAELRSAQGLSSQIAPSVQGLKQEVVTRLQAVHGPDAALSHEDSDTFDLLDLFYQRIERDVQVESLAADLLKRLQLPVLQAALADRAFFTHPQHPARQLLNTVAESGARWLGEGDADPALLAPLQRAVEHVVRHADPQAFETGNRNLQQELQQQARRAEMAERRHVEAARGKEKLHVARELAARCVAQSIGTCEPHKFERALLEHAWTDALTLAAVRQGEDSEEWARMREATRRIAAACCGSVPAPDPELSVLVEAALAQVGYHPGEAASIARRLSAHQGGDEAPASRTQLAAILKARTPLGGTAAPQPVQPPRTPDEEAQYQRMQTLPFGTWIEFVLNQQGDVIRQRLSWYSRITGHALFVNARGQRVGEQSLDSVARLLARGQARVVTMERARLVDRAWQATLVTLRGLARREPGDGRSTPA